MKLSFLSPAYRDYPDAEAFCEVLSQYLPDWSSDMVDYAWDAEIPPREQWEQEAADLAKHLNSL